MVQIIYFRTHYESCSWKIVLRRWFPDFWRPAGFLFRSNFIHPIYTQPIFEIFRKNKLNYHGYADDIQAYASCKNNENTIYEKKLEIESCVSEVKVWMDGNRLKLNETKTECLILANKNVLELFKSRNHSPFSLSLGGSEIVPLANVKNLGVYLDSDFKMNTHVNALCRSMYFNIRKLSNVRKFITLEAANKIAVQTILSKVDYGNSLLYGVSEELLGKIQVAINNTARVVLGKRKTDSATEMLKVLHWLPVRRRIDYKIATLCYGFFDNSLPQYLSKEISLYKPSRNLRSSNDERIFKVPKTNLKLGERAWRFAAPTVWNALPTDIRYSESKAVFKKRLKTFYFSL